MLIFIISKLLWILLRPSSLLLLLGLFGLLLLFLRRRRGALTFLSLSLGGMALAVMLPIGPLLLSPLEDRFPTVTDPPAQVDGIIVLGGALETEISEARGMPSLNDAAERMTTFVTLAHRYPKAILAFTGGNGHLLRGRLTEADVARALFESLGLPADRMHYENASRTTYENAVHLKAVLAPRPEQHWILITSAWHMPRSVGLFRKAGWTVLPWPVAYKTAWRLDTLILGGLPERLGMIDVAIHEWVGLGAYWLLGRSSALFPAPQAVTPR
jgi:uncharacterized SAM-binding protein YcdF (DUF218 family)